ncbi:MAG: alpha/beta hydrolase [bacterium]
MKRIGVRKACPAGRGAMTLAAAAILAAPGTAQGQGGEGMEVKSRKDIPYLETAADSVRQVLDVFAPEGVEGAPVMVFVHGGAFHMSDKADGRYYPETGERLARAGFVAVLPNYRLTPETYYPGHAEDVAGAVAWTFRHIAGYGGDPSKVFLSGHSAGGLLAAAVALDRDLLADHGTEADALRGVIPICGQFQIIGPGRQGTFGEDSSAWSRFSPLSLIRPDAPPFLVLEASGDDWWAPGQAEVFADALEIARVPFMFRELEHDHYSIITGLGTEGDPTLGLIRDFTERMLRP